MQELLREKDEKIALLECERDSYRALLEGLEVPDLDGIGEGSNIISFTIGAAMARLMKEVIQDRADLLTQREKADALAKIGEEAARLLNWDDFNQALIEYLEARHGNLESIKE